MCPDIRVSTPFTDNEVTRYESPLAIHYFAATLTAFRKKLEEEAGETVAEMDLNAATMLYDLCRFTGLDNHQMTEVIGKSVSALFEMLEVAQFELVEG